MIVLSFENMVYSVCCVTYLKITVICTVLYMGNTSLLLLTTVVSIRLTSNDSPCVSGPSKPCLMGTKCPNKDGCIQNPCPHGDIFWSPLGKQLINHSK